MNELGFPILFVTWVVTSVRSVSFRYSVNDRPTKRVVRQGDLISPLLFVIVLEYLHRCLDKLRCQPDFNYHLRCEKLRITSLCFADDLLMFTRGARLRISPAANEEISPIFRSNMLGG